MSTKQVDQRVATTVTRTSPSDPKERERIGGYARAVAEAETTHTDGSVSGGTGQTILRLAEKKGLMRLATAGQIGREELIAADEIQTGFNALSAPASIKGASLMKVDGGGLRDGLPWTVHVQHVVKRYTRWANHWSARAKQGDPTYRIAMDALIAERPFSELGRKYSMGAGSSAKALVNALRDYAARAGLCTQDLAEKWKTDAERMFARRMRNPAAALAA